MRRMTMLALASAWLAAGLPAPAAAEVKVQCPDRPGVRCYHITAGDGFTKMADGQDLYSFGFMDVTDQDPEHAMHAGMLGANFPAPTLIAREGEEVYLTLTNAGMLMRPDLFDPHTVHWHGFPNAAPVFDGVPDAALAIEMSSSLTYYYKVNDPGTYMYHCHVEATEHMQMGMLGQLYVLPKQDGQSFTHDGRTFTHFAYNDGDGSTGYDRDFALQLAGFDQNFHRQSEEVQPLDFAGMRDTHPMINGRGYPDTIQAEPVLNVNGAPSQPVNARIEGRVGQRVLLRLSNLSVTRYYTVTVLGLPLRLVGQGARLLRSPAGQDLSRAVGSVTLGGGESADVLLDLKDAAPGTYFLYTTNLDGLSNGAEDLGGMMTEIQVTE